MTQLNKNKQKFGCCLVNYNWFYQFRGHIYLNEKPFCLIRFSFLSNPGFWGNFWRFLTKSTYLFYAVSTFNSTENGHPEHTVSMRKSVLKMTQPGPKYLRKSCIDWQFGLLCHVEKCFCSAWLWFKLNTRKGLRTHHLPPPTTCHHQRPPHKLF